MSGTKIYNIDDLSDSNWKKYFLLSEQNKNDHTSYHLEHHIGRFNSIKKILNSKIDGHFLEFGTWKGHSFYNILYLMEMLGIFDRKLIGIDGFVGIPEGYGHVCCPDKLFNNTSYNECLRNIQQRENSFVNQKNNYYLLESFYNNTERILGFLKEKNINKVSFVHLDCDVVKSCEEVVALLVDNNLLNDECFLHFDDWGIGTGIPEWFENCCKTKLSEYYITKLYETRITRSFRLNK